MRFQSLLIAAAVLQCVAAFPARAADAREEIISTLTKFADALEAGDGATLAQSIWVYENSLADAAGRDVFIKLALAEKQLERVAVARFGAAAAGRFRCGFSSIFSKDDRAALMAADIALDPDGAARVQKAGETYAMRLRRQRGGGWQVVLDFLETEIEDDSVAIPTRIEIISRIKLDRFEGLAANATDVAARVERGEYASATAAEADLVARFEQVVIEYIAKRNAAAPGRRLRYYR